MDYIGLWMEVPLKPGTRDEAAKTAAFALERAMEDTGSVVFAVNASDSDPDRLFVYELYRDQAAMDAHNAAEWMPEYLSKMEPFIGGAPSMHVIRPLLGKGI
jgi:quinol monooxygenase YgiN